jgi:hypothetical protein
MTLTHSQIVAIFTEWARRFVDEPNEFDQIVDGDHHFLDVYGEKAAREFELIAFDLFYIPTE